MTVNIMAETQSEGSPWIACSERLPDFNQRVVAYLDGTRVHSHMCWKRTGFAFMVRHDNDQYTVADKWSSHHYDKALKEMDADMATVTHWMPLELPK